MIKMQNSRGKVNIFRNAPILTKIFPIKMQKIRFCFISRFTIKISSTQSRQSYQHNAQFFAQAKGVDFARFEQFRRKSLVCANEVLC